MERRPAAGAAPHAETDAPATAARGDVTESLMALSRMLVGITARTLATMDADLTLAQYRTLVLLVSHGPLRSVDLAGHLDVHPSTVSRMADRLVRKGLVQRRTDAHDRRAAWLALTRGGKHLIGTVLDRRGRHLRHLAARAAPADPASFVAAVDQLLAAAGELPEPHWWQRWERSADRDPAGDGTDGD